MKSTNIFSHIEPEKVNIINEMINSESFESLGTIFISGKGGVCKTTMATGTSILYQHIFNAQVHISDFDHRQQSAHFFDKRKEFEVMPAMDSMNFSDFEEVTGELKKLVQAGKATPEELRGVQNRTRTLIKNFDPKYKFKIFDTKGGNEEDSNAAAVDSNIIIIPTSYSINDLKGTVDTLKQIRSMIESEDKNLSDYVIKVLICGVRNKSCSAKQKAQSKVRSYVAEHLPEMSGDEFFFDSVIVNYESYKDTLDMGTAAFEVCSNAKYNINSYAKELVNVIYDYLTKEAK